MQMKPTLAALASLGLLAACEPDAADTGDEIVNTAPTITTTDSAAEQIENEAETLRKQADQQAEMIERNAEAQAENVKQSAEKAAERLDAQAEQAEQAGQQR
jgi:Skp family chaperone for outer membrane proteins